MDHWAADALQRIKRNEKDLARFKASVVVGGDSDGSTGPTGPGVGATEPAGPGWFKASVTGQTGFASDTVLTGTVVTMATGGWQAGQQYHATFDMTKTATGTATPIISVRMGTAGTTSDGAVATITFAAGTGVADTGIFDVWVNFRTVGSGTSAVIEAVSRCCHLLAATGLTSTGASGTGIIVASTSSGFNSSACSKLHLSFNGGTNFSGTCQIQQAAVMGP